MSERRPTIVDVAREAGVSRSLVSLVLQNPDKVSPVRKQAVHDAMKRLGYRPNAAARTLAQRRTDTIGVLVSDLHNPFYTEVIDGISQVTETLGLRTLIASGGLDPKAERAAANTFIELRVEGMIMITPRLTNQEIADIAALCPTVVVGRPGERPAGCSRVHTDDAIGIGLALDHLVGLGHERIAHVSAGDNPGARAREAAYRDAMVRLDLERNIEVVKAAPNQEGGYDGARELLTLTDAVRQLDLRPAAAGADDDDQPAAPPDGRDGRDTAARSAGGSRHLGGGPRAGAGRPCDVRSAAGCEAGRRRSGMTPSGSGSRLR